MGNVVSAPNKTKPTPLPSPPSPLFSDTDDDSIHQPYKRTVIDSDDETDSDSDSDTYINTDINHDNDYNSINSFESFDSHSLTSDIGSNIFKFIDDSIRFLPNLTCNHPLNISSNILHIISTFGQNIDHSNIHFFTTKKYKFN